MEIELTLRHIKSTEAIEDHLEEKLSKLDKFFSEGAVAHVTLSVDRHEHVAHIELLTSGAMRVRAEESSEDLYASIDKAVEKLLTQVRRYRDKVSHHREPSRSREFNHHVFEMKMSGDDEQIQLEPPKVVRQETVIPKEMNRDDAVLNMELLNSDFLIYTDVDSNNVHVLYRLKDGRYGLIEAQHG